MAWVKLRVYWEKQKFICCFLAILLRCFLLVLEVAILAKWLPRKTRFGRPVESHSGVRRNFRGAPNISRGPSGKKIFEFFLKWYILAYFIFLADGGAPKRRWARGSLPPTPPSWQACVLEMSYKCIGRYNVSSRTQTVLTRALIVFWTRTRSVWRYLLELPFRQKNPFLLVIILTCFGVVAEEDK